MFIIGIILILLGIVFFLQNTGFIPYDTWSNLWPIVLVLVGLWFLFTRRGRETWRGWMGSSNMTAGWGGRREDRGMGSTESRAYGHEEEENKERMHDKRQDEM